MEQDLLTLDFDRIVEQLQSLAASEPARERLAALAPSLNENVCRRLMDETTAARAMLDSAGSPPLAVMERLAESLSQAAAGGMLEPEWLSGFASFAVSCRRVRCYLARGEGALNALGAELPDLSDLQEDIERCVDGDRITDQASAELRVLRRQRDAAEAAVKERLARVLTAHRRLLADGYVTQRGGRYVVPVLRRYQSAFPGTVVDASAKGTTLFMEPNAVAPLRETVEQLDMVVAAEERRVLYALSDRVASREADLSRGMALMTDIDVLFARAKLSAAMNAREVMLTAGGPLVIREGRHPLLPRDSCVPLTLVCPPDAAGIVITGPNTGGKTVAMKTVGLFVTMAQCGLHLPCAEGTSLPLRDAVLCDVGDGQSIAQSLSTFSAHMKQITRIIAQASRDSLALLDEPGSGTDPQEGMGIAVAVLEALMSRGCFFLATTHDPAVKRWASRAPGVCCARMAFDPQTLAPLYRLELGASGESCGLAVARRLGLPEAILSRAERAARGQTEPETLPLPAPRSRLTLAVRRAAHAAQFHQGDSVLIQPEGVGGIVYRGEDEQGLVIVQAQGEKRAVRHTRLTLRVPASALYPPDYDFSILFDSVANRKAAHVLSRKHDPDAVIVHREGQTAR